MRPCPFVPGRESGGGVLTVASDVTYVKPREG
jgi:hypothetical protein